MHPVSPFGRWSAVSNRAVRRARSGSAGVARSRVHSRSSRCCPCSAKPPRQPTRLRERGPGQQPLQSASSQYIRSKRNDRARLLQIDNPKWLSRGARYRSICLQRFSSRPRDNDGSRALTIWPSVLVSTSVACGWRSAVLARDGFSLSLAADRTTPSRQHREPGKCVATRRSRRGQSGSRSKVF